MNNIELAEKINKLKQSVDEQIFVHEGDPLVPILRKISKELAETASSLLFDLGNMDK